MVRKPTSNKGLNRADSTTSSAKEHYLRQSRYLPGVNPKSSSSAGSQVAGRGRRLEFPLNKDISLPKRTDKQPLKENALEDLDLLKDSFMSNSNNPTKMTHTSPFQMTETGAVRQRMTLAPIGGASAIDLSSAADLRIDSKIKPSKNKTSNKLQPSNEKYDGWKSRSLNPQIPCSSTSSTGRNTNIQPIHGRVDWTAKYGGHW
ncbi:hypothetical protein PAMA_004765 [Pampus argenteus]